MSSIIVAGDTSGTVTLAAPAVAGTTTLTLPATSGNVVTDSATQTLTNKTLTSPTITGANITVASTAAPAFSAYLSSTQTPSNLTWTKIQMNAENFDTNNNFDSTTNYRFTPTVAGYYQVNLMLSSFPSTGRALFARIMKNGIAINDGGIYLASTISTGLDDVSVNQSNIVYMNGSTDYLEFYGYRDGLSEFTSGNGVTNCSAALIRSA